MCPIRHYHSSMNNLFATPPTMQLVSVVFIIIPTFIWEKLMASPLRSIQITKHYCYLCMQYHIENIDFYLCYLAGYSCFFQIRKAFFMVLFFKCMKYLAVS